MATRKKSATSSSKGKKSTGAVALLTADHNKVKKLFKEFEALHEKGSDGDAEAIAKSICHELTMHATLEEEIFYPEVRDAIGDEDLIDEAEVEHASAKDLIAQIEGMKWEDEKYAAKVMVLSEYIDHHVKEEQNEIFPKAVKAKIDMEALGERIAQRKQELQAELGMPEEEEEEVPATRGLQASRKPSARART